MRTSRSPTPVITANGEVQTREEATVYVKQLDLFVKVMLLEETPAVLSLGKLCEGHGYTYPTEQQSKNNISSKRARESIAIHPTMYHLWILACRPVPLQRPHLLHHRISCQVYFSVKHYTREESGKKTLRSPTLKNRSRWTHLNSTPESSMKKEVLTLMSGEEFISPIAD